MMVTAASVRPSRRTVTRISALSPVLAIAVMKPRCAPAPEGCAIARMPRKPTITALQRWTPTLSPSSGTERAVRKSGVAEEMESEPAGAKRAEAGAEQHDGEAGEEGEDVAEEADLDHRVVRCQPLRR